MKKILLGCLFLILSVISLQAQNDVDKDSNSASLPESIDYNLSNNDENAFTANRKNYLLPITLSNYNVGRQRVEAKFQISIKERLLKFYGWAAYFGYTQKSFWQVYDPKRSSPFRENDFNPEVFVRTKMWNGIRADFGFEHESNGVDGLASRSWNRVYLTTYYENEYMIVWGKGWYRIPEKRKTSPTDAEGDDNPDILKYYGYDELGLTAKIPQLHNLHISTISRYNFKYGKGSVEVNASIPLFLSNMSFLVQYWNGYGESLIDYNVKQQKIGVGFFITR